MVIALFCFVVIFSHLFGGNLFPFSFFKGSDFRDSIPLFTYEMSIYIYIYIYISFEYLK